MLGAMCGAVMISIVILSYFEAVEKRKRFRRGVGKDDEK